MSEVSREKIIDMIATEIQCSDMLSECDDFEMTVKGLVWGTRIYDVLIKNEALRLKNVEEDLVFNLKAAVSALEAFGIPEGGIPEMKDCIKRAELA